MTENQDLLPPHLRTLAIEEQRLWQIRTHEEAVLVDATSGRVIWRRSGFASRVEFTLLETQQMAGQVLTHNHPRGWSYPDDDPRHAGSAFSSTDVAMFVTSGLQEIRAVSPGYRHSLRPPDDSDLSFQAMYFRRQIRLLSFDEVKFLVRQRSMTVRQLLRYGIENDEYSLSGASAIAEHQHEVCKSLAAGWGVKYTRKEWNQ